MVSKGQRVDWLTMDIEPVIAARLTDWLTIEYSRTMRSFDQDDQVVTNGFTRATPMALGRPPCLRTTAEYRQSVGCRRHVRVCA